MTIADGASLLSVNADTPELGTGAFVAAGARLIGAVTLGAGASVWYNAVLRADGDRITIGEDSNVQDGVSIHVDHGVPVTVGREVSIGHNAVIHGCTIGDGSLIGMGAVILNGAKVGSGCLVAAGAVVLEGTDIPDGSLVAGVPAKVRRPLTEEERAGLRANADAYRRHTADHRDAR